MLPGKLVCLHAKQGTTCSDIILRLLRQACECIVKSAARTCHKVQVAPMSSRRQMERSLPRVSTFARAKLTCMCTAAHLVQIGSAHGALDLQAGRLVCPGGQVGHQGHLLESPLWRLPGLLHLHALDPQLQEHSDLMCCMESGCCIWEASLPRRFWWC